MINPVLTGTPAIVVWLLIIAALIALTRLAYRCAYESGMNSQQDEYLHYMILMAACVIGVMYTVFGIGEHVIHAYVLAPLGIDP